MRQYILRLLKPKPEKPTVYYGSDYSAGGRSETLCCINIQDELTANLFQLIENAARLILMQFAMCDVSLQRLKSLSTNLRKSRFPMLEQAYIHTIHGPLSQLCFSFFKVTGII